MRSALAIRHVAFEDLGALEAVLERRGYRVRYCDVVDGGLHSADVVESDLLVCLGGPISVYDMNAYPFLKDELAALEARLARGRPTIGICLGSQLIAHAFGARVRPNGAKEIGLSPIELTEEGRRSCLAPLDGGETVLHWHGDTFDLPKGATHLARTNVCENQAFSVGRCVLGLQFHLEVSPPSFERWLVGHAFELATAGLDPQALRVAMRERGPSIVRAGTSVLERWLDGLEDER